MYKLAFRRPAFDNRAHYREHDPVRSEAHESALDGIRDGTAFSRTIRSENVAAHLTPVPVAGRAEEDVIVWEVVADERVDIIYLGPLI